MVGKRDPSVSKKRLAAERVEKREKKEAFGFVRLEKSRGIVEERKEKKE